MTLLDFILLGIVVVAAVTGAMRGIVAQIGAIVALLAAILVCRFFGGTVANALVTAGCEHETVYRTLCYAAVFLGTYLLVWLVARLIGAAVSALHLRFVDRFAGAIFRVCEWLIIVSIVLNVYLAVCPDERASMCPADKPWRGAVVKIAPTLEGYIMT